MPFKQETDDDDKITNKIKYVGTNDSNCNKLLIDNINNALSSSKEDEMTNDNKDNKDRNEDDLSTLLGVNNILVEDIEADSVL